MFEALVRDGLEIQRKTQAVAEEKMAEAATRMTSMAGDIHSRAGEPWGRLESIFEERVARALQKLGVPSGADLRALNERIDRLASGRPAASGASSAPVASRTPTPATAAPKKAAPGAASRPRKPA